MSSRWHQLELGQDAGGRRWFLRSPGYSEPVETGASLILFAWGWEFEARFELDGNDPLLIISFGAASDGPVPVLECKVVRGIEGIRARFDTRWSR